MNRGVLLKLVLLTYGLWLIVDMIFLLGLDEAGRASGGANSIGLFCTWVATDALLLCSAVAILLQSKSGVVGLLAITGTREGMLAYSGKSPSIAAAAVAVITATLVFKHWSTMHWGLLPAWRSSSTDGRSTPSGDP